MIGALVTLVLLFFPAADANLVSVAQVGCESDWRPHVTSETGAGGIWQLTDIAIEDARRLDSYGVLPSWDFRYDPWWSTVAVSILKDHYGPDGGHVWAESEGCWR